MKSSATVNGGAVRSYFSIERVIALNRPLSRCIMCMRDTCTVSTRIEENVERLNFSRQSGQSYLGSTVTSGISLHCVRLHLEKNQIYLTHILMHRRCVRH